MRLASKIKKSPDLLFAVMLVVLKTVGHPEHISAKKRELVKKIEEVYGKLGLSCRCLDSSKIGEKSLSVEGQEFINIGEWEIEGRRGEVEAVVDGGEIRKLLIHWQ